MFVYVPKHRFNCGGLVVNVWRFVCLLKGLVYERIVYDHDDSELNAFSVYKLTSKCATCAGKTYR